MSMVRKTGKWSGHGSCALIIVQFSPFDIFVIKISRISGFFPS